jgi:hypothetical protein
MLDTDFTSAFARDRRRCQKKHWDIAALDEAIIAVEQLFTNIHGNKEGRIYPNFISII